MKYKKLKFGLLTAAGLSLAFNSVHAGQGPQPGICLRACWGARAPTCGISQMGALTRAIIHHTAGAGDYSTDLNNSKAKMRGVQNLHINNGWCDIAYHFLVDAAGNIFEGRSGSMSGLPRGTHDGNNSNSFGFTMLGYFHPPYNHNPNGTMRSSLYDVIAWRMPSAWSPYGSGTYNGNNVGFLDGHRKVKATACPGDGMYFPFITDNRSGGEARDLVNARKSPPPPPPPAPKNTGTHFVTPDGRNCAFGIFTDGSVRSTSQFYDNGPWGGWQLLSPGVGYTQIDPMYLPDGRFICFGVGEGTPAWINWQTNVSSGWIGWQYLGETPNQKFNFIQGRRYDDGRLAAFACTSGNGEVWSNAQVENNGSWGGWQFVGGVGFSMVYPMLTTDQRFIMFGVGNGTTTWINRQTAPSGGWTGWQNLGGPNLSYIRGFILPDGRVTVMGVGYGTEVWSNTEFTPGGAWGGWMTLSPGTGFTRIDPIMLPDGRFVCFAVGHGTQVWINWQNAPSSAWVGWQGLGNTGSTMVDGLVRPDGRLTVYSYGYGTTESINWQNASNGPWAGWVSLGGTLK